LPNPIEFIHKEGASRADFVKKLHEKVKIQIQQQSDKYARQNNKGKKAISFEEGDWVWLHLRKDRFPKQRKSKLSPRGDGPFKILKKINNNAYQLDLPEDYGVHTTFNVIDLIPFVGSNDDEVDNSDLRTDPLQDGGDDGGGLRQGPIARAMLRHLEANKESKAPVQIKMLTILTFEDSCKNYEK